MNLLINILTSIIILAIACSIATWLIVRPDVIKLKKSDDYLIHFKKINNKWINLKKQPKK